MPFNRQNRISLFIFILPFLVFQWMLPFFSHIYPDQDYSLMFSFLQAEYIFSLKTGTFPLNIVWHQIQNNQWAGIFNPFLLLAAVLSGFSNGKLLDWVLFLHLALLAITHLMLFRFLRRLLFPSSIAFILSLITVYSPRLTLSFSVAGAVTVWTGYLLLCMAVGYYCLKPSGNTGPLSIIGLSYWLFSSGYPQETYFSLLGTTLFTLFIPYLLAAILPDSKPTAKAILSFWGKTAFFCLIGSSLAAAFTIPFLMDNFSEIGLSQKVYSEACIFSSSLPELLNNFFIPLRASSSGLIGGSPLLLTALLIPLLTACRVRIPWVIWALWSMAVLVMICMLGDHTPVHYYVWKYVPLFSVTRYANRISMLLPVLFLLMLMWLFKAVDSSWALKKSASGRPLSLLACLSLCLTIGFTLVMLRASATLPPSLTKINLEIIPAWVEPLLLISGIAILIVVALYGHKTDSALKGRLGLLLAILTCFQLIVFYRYAPLARKKLACADQRTFSQFLADKQWHNDLFLGKYIYGFEKVLYPGYAVRQWEKAGPQPLLAKIYRNHINVKNRAEAYALLDRRKQEDALVVAGYPGDDDLPRPLSPARLEDPDSARLTYNSNNRLVFEARAGQPSFFMFAYHHTGHWRAFVNGRPSATYPADGNYHAVRIPAGKSLVEFRCWSPAAFGGMLITCLTLAAIGCYYGLLRRRDPAGYGIALATGLAAAALLWFWHHALYNGDNLHTHYFWQASSQDAPLNIAYGKPTRASRPPFGPLRLNLIHNSAYAVDGECSFASCFSTGTHLSPWLEIDLLKPQAIGTIVIYADLQGLETDNIVWYTEDSVRIAGDYDFLVFEKAPVSFNLPPLLVSLSLDHAHWETAAIDSMIKKMPLTIRPEKPVMARYLRINASGTCRLCLNEVEVFPDLSNQ